MAPNSFAPNNYVTVKILYLSVTSPIRSQLSLNFDETLHRRLETNKKAQLTQGLRAVLRATATSFQDDRQPPYYRTGSSTMRFADPETPSVEPDMEWIGCTVCEIFAFKLYCDLETGVQGHSRSSKAAPLDRPTPKT